jgi:hypothetical protein
MSKLDCLFSLKQKLNDNFTKLAASNAPAAQTFQRLLLAADNIDDGFYAQIKPFYDPLTAAFLSKTQALNDSIVSGGATLANFNEYIKLLTASLLA